MAITVKEAYFNSSTGTNKIRCLIWQDKEQIPKAIFQIAHGVCEHIERYDEFARFLAEKGFIVCGNDHLGHGKSAESLEKLGYTCEHNGHIRMVDDMHILTKIMKKKYPDLPYILFGHSMGSFCARNYAAKFGDELSGVIFCGTGDFPQLISVAEGPVKALTENFGAATPATALSHKFNVIMNRQFASGSRTDYDWLSKNPENVEKYICDPYCGFVMTYSLARDVLMLASECSTAQWPEQIPVGLPIMMISGARDPVGANGRAIISVCDKLMRAGHNPEVILYPDNRHEILNEDDREKIFGDIYTWLTDVLNGEVL